MKNNMGKIYPVSTKYTVVADIVVEGEINKNDIVGAIFGQTEGLLGDDLELRELQKSGRIGRIDVNIEFKNGKSVGQIIVPSSLAKTETAVIAAALETIDKIGPCNSEIKIKELKDVRLDKRTQITERAQNLLKKLNMDSTDSQEIMDKVQENFRTSSIIEYGKDKLAASEDIEETEEAIIVEGRADVANLVKYNIKGVIAINGVNVPDSIRPILESKSTTLFIDGDRGGEMIAKKLMSKGDIDFIAIAPDGKEVEELAGKEIFKCLRNRMKMSDYLNQNRGNSNDKERPRNERGARRDEAPKQQKAEPSKYKNLMNDLFGTRGAYLLDEKDEVLAKIPLTEISNALAEVKKVETVVIDGIIDEEIVKLCEKKKIKNLVSRNVKASSDKINIIKA
ncbi:MAG: DNA primase DnaG [Candidatus Nanoarchaeia archaeon]|nr:DNA primase DnaG [Candidatus Nanoarchaeia archaeon]